MTTRHGLIVRATILLLLAGMPGCRIQQTGRADSLAEGAVSSGDRVLASDVRLAVTIARALHARPDSAAAILEAHRLTRTGMDSLLYRVAMDPELAAQYDREIGRRRTGEVD